VTRYVGADTGTGTSESVVVPSPRSPNSLDPQQSIVPEASTAHGEAPSPLVTLIALVMPVTATGMSESVVVPSPSCPSPLYPQQCTVPVASSAQYRDVSGVLLRVRFVAPDSEAHGVDSGRPCVSVSVDRLPVPTV
jgi:hypothetical protein